MNDTRMRMEAIAALLLGNYRDAIGAANAAWLANRLRHDDWQEQDRIRLQEILPASLNWLLQQTDAA